MSELAIKRMTVDEFLIWDDGTDTRYELIDGVPVAMSPSYQEHQIVSSNINYVLTGLLRNRPPCHVRTEAGVLKPNSFRNYFQADLAVTCSPHERTQYSTPNPIIIVEMLSPSTEQYDRKVKLPVYRSIPSVQEIVLIRPADVFCEIHRRLDDTRWQADLLTELEQEVRLDSIGYAGPLSAFYVNVDLPAPEPVAPEPETP